MASAVPLPEQFGRYRILRKLGEGGMGAVYLAEDIELGRRVALKVPHFTAADGSDVIERFKREARAAAALRHPNLCPVHDVGHIHGIHFLTMPFIEGKSLAEQVRRDQPWPPARAAALVIRLARALDVLHQHGMMHRDLKPVNILLEAGDEPVIMDFGLARSLSQSDRLTQTGIAVGTPAYMSPEQFLGVSSALSSATDIWSLGVIFYQLLTGQLPFPGPTQAAMLGQILYAELQPPSKLRPELARELDAVCQKALAKQAGARYATMAELAAALQGYLDARKPVFPETVPWSGGSKASAPPPVSVPREDIYTDVAVVGPGPAPPPAGSVPTWLRLICPRCGKELKVPVASAGKRMRCPACNQPIVLGTGAPTLPMPVPPNPEDMALTPTPRPPSSPTERAPRRRPAPRQPRGPLVGVVVLVLLMVVLLIWVVASGWGSKQGSDDGGSRASTGSSHGESPGTKRELPATVVATNPTTERSTTKQPTTTVPTTKTPQPIPPAVEPKPFDNSIGMRLVPIPVGSFWMGSVKNQDKDAYDWELPRHEVHIGKRFFLAAYKTTQAQFNAVLGRNPSWFSTSGGGNGQVAGLNTGWFPVENVNFFDAVEFCNRLSEKEGLQPCYRLTGAQAERLSEGTGYRLPTEAEWEYCARAGTKTRYWFGDDAGRLGGHAWFVSNSGSRTHLVGEKGANPWGLYDMHGLLWEWCEDVWHENYQGAPTDGSAWLVGGEPGRRVVRGGSWVYVARYCRSAIRDWFVPGSRDYIIGFRVVRVSP
jgi:formylglycine-generating enzyme required for sulfatase activity/serine/threonine protein kinase